MNAVAGAARQLAHLFVEDGALALAVIAVVILAAVAAFALPEQPLVAGGVLLLGCLAALLANAATAARRARGP